MGMDSDRIRAEIDRKISMRLGRCLCDVIINPDESAKFVCVGADFVIIIKSSDEHKKCILNFMEQNNLKFTVIDPDSSDGEYIMELSGLSEIDLPIIFSRKQGTVVDGWRCPDYMEVLLQDER